MNKDYDKLAEQVSQEYQHEKEIDELKSNLVKKPEKKKAKYPQTEFEYNNNNNYFIDGYNQAIDDYEAWEKGSQPKVEK